MDRDNHSAVIREQLQALGAKVDARMTRNTTHVMVIVVIVIVEVIVIVIVVVSVEEQLKKHTQRRT